MKILWFSNAPWSSTGYGNQTRLFVPRLAAAGHEVAIAAFYGLEGAVLHWGNIRVYPRAFHPYGQDVMAAHSQHFGADISISLMDAWVCEPSLYLGPTRWCLPGHALVTLADGQKLPIKDIVDQQLPMRVLAEQDGKLVGTCITGFHAIPGSEAGEIIEIVTVDGRKLEVTAENGIAVAMPDGAKWITAGSILAGMMVYCEDSIPLEDSNEQGTADGKYRAGPDQRLSARTQLGRMGIHGGDRGWGGNDLYPASKEAGALHPNTQGVRVQYRPGLVGLASATGRDAGELTDTEAGSLQDTTTYRVRGDGQRLSVLQSTGRFAALLDRKEAAGGIGDALYRKSERTSGNAVQPAILRGADESLAWCAGAEPTRVISVRRLGRPYATVYDLTTSTGNFFADDVLVHNCPWFPVDMEPIPPPVLRSVRQAWQGIVYSRFGERMAREAGLEVHYVPHGVDTNVFKPVDRREARRHFGWPEDAFVVGMVAANKGNPSRKAFTAQIEAFAQLRQKHQDAILYLHTTKCENGENQGVNLVEFCRSVGLDVGKDVLFPDQYRLVMGFPDEYLRDAYSGMDVLLSVSMGEGFGIPILEAQACGTPVIVGDWTSMPELCFAGWKVPQSEAERWWTPLGAYQWAPRVSGILSALRQAYQSREATRFATMARQGALKYDADLVVKQYWQPVLADLEERVSLARKAQQTIQAEWMARA